MATSAGTIYLNGCNYELQYDILNQDQATNTTTVRFYGILNVTAGYVAWGSRTKAWAHYSENRNFGYRYNRGSHELVRGDYTFEHDANGNKTQNVGFGIETSFVSGSSNVNITFPHINRVGVIQTFTGNDLSGNFSATYTTYVSGYTYKLRISIPNKVELMKVDNYESGTGVSLNETALSLVKNYLDNYHTNKVIIGGVIETWSGSTEIGESQELKNECSFIDGQPTFTYTTTETNANIVSLLGSSADTVVKNASIVNFNIVPTTKYDAGMDAVRIATQGFSKTLTASPYTVNVPVQSDSFNVEVVDLRTNYTRQTITKTLIDYLAVDVLSVSFKRVNPTSSNVLVNLEATYYQQTFGSTANAPIVKWKLDDGNYTTIPSTEYTIDNTNHKLTITNYVLTNVLDYRQKGTFTIYIEDKITSDQDSKDVIKGIPTCDWGEHDFKVNGDLYIADNVGENKVNVLEECLDKYSSSEIKVGIWINDKPIYRKVIDTGSISSTSKTVSHGISNLGEVIKLYGMCYTSNNQSYLLPRVSTVADQQIGLFATTGSIGLVVGNDANFDDSFVVIEYTKTTD